MTMGPNLVTAYEPAVVAELFLDATILEKCKGHRGLAVTTGADERDWRPSVDEANYPLDQLCAPGEVSWGRWR